MERFALLLALLAVSSIMGLAQVSGEQGKPFVVEYYYKAKWGHADECLRLFKKNHLQEFSDFPPIDFHQGACNDQR